MLGHFVSPAARDLTYVKGSPHRKDVTTDKIWTSELGVEDGIVIPIYIIVAFMQKD